MRLFEGQFEGRDWLCVRNAEAMVGSKYGLMPCEEAGLCVSRVLTNRYNTLCEGGRERINPPPLRVGLKESVQVLCKLKCFEVCVSKDGYPKYLLGTISIDYLDQSVGRSVYLCDLSRRFASRDAYNKCINPHKHVYNAGLLGGTERIPTFFNGPADMDRCIKNHEGAFTWERMDTSMMKCGACEVPS
eukprot:1187564-Prorocentrum_minimum.AAC.1